VVIGAAAGLLGYGAVQLEGRLHYDDALDVVGVHRVAGFVGVVLTGVFASLAVDALGIIGGWLQLGRQSVLAMAGLLYPFVMTLIILWVVDRVVGLRVSADEEAGGLDMGEHAESAYEWPWDTIRLKGVNSLTQPDIPVSSSGP
jgi:Amt family ammonium transporter